MVNSEERFLRNKMLIDEPAVKLLADSHVAVFGLGGVGSFTAEALARAGIGELTLIDYDMIGASNINRQLFALNSTVGSSKTAVAISRLTDINPELRLHPVQARYDALNSSLFFENRYDFVADAIDLVSCKLDLIERSHKLGLPIISALGTGNKLDASKLSITDISKTFNCPFARVIRKELRRREILRHTVVFSPEPAREPLDAEPPPPGRRSIPGSIVWVPACAGMLMAQHIVLTLIDESSY